jgi:DNA repair exonuclease SbcCD ATPase subunit
MIVLLCLPAAYNGLITFLEDIVNRTKIDESIGKRKMQLADDKYLLFFEDAVDTESTRTDMEAMLEHMKTLNDRMLKMSQQLESATQEIHQSKELLDTQESHSKQHTTQLEKQMGDLKLRLSSLGQDSQREHEEREVKLDKYRAQVVQFESNLREERENRERDNHTAHAEALLALEKQLEEQTSLRRMQEQASQKEKEKRERLAVEHQHAMSVTGAQLQQLQVVGAADEAKRAAELQFRERVDEKMAKMQQEIIHLEKLQSTTTHDKRIEELDRKLSAMKNDREDDKRLQTEQRVLVDVQRSQTEQERQELQARMQSLQRSHTIIVDEQQAIDLQSQQDEQNYKNAISQLQNSFQALQGDLVDDDNSNTNRNRGLAGDDTFENGNFDILFGGNTNENENENETAHENANSNDN